ncbi:hypothetical protein ACFE04_008271 [Oxalis oulophora]
MRIRALRVIGSSRISRAEAMNCGKIRTDQEDDGVQPVVAEDEGDNEKGHTQEYSDAGDYVDEMVDFFGDRRFTGVQTRGQTSDTTHDRIIAAADDNSFGSA